MMTFSEFLAEQKKIKPLKEFLQENCDQFCTDANIFNGGNFLARAAKKLPSTFEPLTLSINGKGLKAGIASVRKDRTPSSMTLSLTRVIDNWFEKEYEVRPRKSALFCVSTANNAVAPKLYGPVNFLVFPIGDYSIAWSDMVKDLYASEADTHVDPDGDVDVKSVEKYLNTLNYKVGSAKQALKSKGELMLMADKVLLIQYDPDNNEKNEISAAISA